MGRFFICCDAFTTKVPSAIASMAVKKRAAVPALPTYISPSAAGILPFCPVTDTTFACSSISSAKPSDCKQARKFLESSLNNTPLSVVVPSANAAIKSALFVTLFDPGTSTTQFTGLSSLWT